MLWSILFTPILGILWLLINNDHSLNLKELDNHDSVRQIRNTTLKFICFTYLLSIILWGGFNELDSNIQYYYSLNNFICIGVDHLSLNYIILTTLTIPIVLLASYNIVNSNARTYLILILIFESLILLVFICQDLLLFYISFESVLIPLCLLTGIYGGANKIKAVYLLFIYTLIGSLPILLGIIKLQIIYGTLNMDILSLIHIDSIGNNSLHWIWWGIFLGLAIKTPLVPFHLWLKTAHAEANTATSIILAGLVLKIASYGFLKIILKIIPALSLYYSSFVIVLALLSIVYTSFTSIRQTDFKQLIAYTSVAHMGLTILGLFSNTVIGIEGAILLSLAHGLTSPALFYLLGSVVYNRYHSRTIRYYRGLSIYIPIFSTFFFLFTMANIAVPSTGNWSGEFIALAGSFQQYPLITIIGSSTIVLSSIYSLFIYNRINFGTWSPYLIPVKDMTRIEFHVILPLTIFIIVLGIYPNIVLNTLHVGISELIYQ